MIDELKRVDNIARYYFLGTSLLALLVAGSSFAANIKWFSVICFALSCVYFFAGMGLLQRKKCGLGIARWLVGIDVFKRNPFSEWLESLKDNQLDQFFR
ncbi:MAG: hypothetical protein HGB32_07795 [Geobacteraceae bacterium]|nr:hypothetical protein [Geobacteraceae bacterium]